MTPDAPAHHVDDADALYEVDPDQFVAARNALVRSLRAAGRRDEAAAVAARRRPSLGVWALNAVARTSPEVVEAAVSSGRAVRAALERGDATALRQHDKEHREAMQSLVARVQAVLAARPARSSAVARQAALDATTATVRSAVVDDAVAEQVRAGRVERDEEADVLGGLAGGFAVVAPVAARPKPARAAGDDAAAAPRADDERRRQLDAARRQVATARRALAVAERDAGRAGERAEESDARARALEERAAEARARAETDRADAAASGAALDDARAALQAAVEACDELERG